MNDTSQPNSPDIRATELPRIDRRTALKWMLTAYASLTLVPHFSRGATVTHANPLKGYGTDPFLNRSYNPGDFWPLTLAAAQRRTVTVLCDLIIPADAFSPSASKVGVPDFIDEWVSAPYDANVHDRELILKGLRWLDEEANRRFGRDFVELAPTQHSTICDDICDQERAAAPLKEAAQFFARFRDLTAGGFYTTPEGMKDVGYVGNAPLATFDGPPEDLIKKLGLA